MTARIDLDGQALVAECPPALDTAARSLLEKLRELHARGPRLHPGSVIEFGWAPLRIEPSGEVWYVCEPDFAHGAQHFVRGVGVTLRVLDDQARVIHLTGAAARATRFDETVLVSDRAWDAPRVVCDRARTATAGYSGWHIGADDDAPAQAPATATKVSAGELAVRRPAWAAVLALPAGYLATFEGDRLTAVYDERSRQVASFGSGDPMP
jgi:hypothetical protein